MDPNKMHQVKLRRCCSDVVACGFYSAIVGESISGFRIGPVDVKVLTKHNIKAAKLEQSNL